MNGFPQIALGAEAPVNFQVHQGGDGSHPPVIRFDGETDKWEFDWPQVVAILDNKDRPVDMVTWFCRIAWAAKMESQP